MKKNNRKFGFTLIELLVVISIIGVLATLIMANLNAARERARDATRKSDMEQISKALRLYYNDHNAYPANAILENNWNTASFSDPDGTMIYMKWLPQDPNFVAAADNGYKYRPTADSQDFCLWATLENSADRDTAGTQNRCATACNPDPIALTFTANMYVKCAN